MSDLDTKRFVFKRLGMDKDSVDEFNGIFNSVEKCTDMDKGSKVDVHVGKFTFDSGEVFACKDDSGQKALVLGTPDGNDVLLSDGKSVAHYPPNKKGLHGVFKGAKAVMNYVF